MADAKWIEEYDRECEEIVEAKLAAYTGFKPYPVNKQEMAALRIADEAATTTRKEIR